VTTTLETRPAPAPAAGATVRDVRIAIIGSGFAGLGMAITLRERGETDFVVLERAGDVGGTWRDNHYPGAACDVQSNLYSFLFAPNPDWPRSYSEQPEIRPTCSPRPAGSACCRTACSAPR
jgi:cation diffusion facilitator CzcD-associated flavoprotein CzcO